ncbi:hypothetical protein SELMODRAFT_442739 [Selaginella moellendorffii]|uniref:FYVE-type domain-containing protein n=1 Tax=Selaginella moellendorffii TaxID=88036 RepID=D8RVN4_SELML|nr:calponin homology domain-containing protein DDB_G0272472 [Selaginella moellendorffii]EFJ23988.1 hypothetical protein SELMODRAFT_442739 [Selaginella moellendorffii]|eukprot:XP_002975203.1 calponin homology domain-containing protein DDB_G0272472 [Selaginella moellendorffii]
MLEKIGLPPRPSARGRTWVVDASHCQNCASPFSIFNRKHHCRRCGGLFCGNCVQSRMYLRGQGDAPVRICEPCKKLEEAARFEARQGRKKKVEETSDEEDLLKSLLVNKESEPATSEPVSPETLRQQAQEARATYSALKKEGKAEDATKAFRRAKELERQADALALFLRRNVKKASKASSATEENTLQTTKSENFGKTVGMSSERPSRRSTGDEDLMKELRDLGWSEDLDRKKASDADILSEGEPTSGTAAGTLQMEILGLKRKALALKREGKMAEAKEELKKAKVLERRLEDIQTLGEDVLDEEEDGGDEVSAVLKALEKEVDTKHKGSGKEVPLSAASLPVVTEEDEAQVHVSDTDMSDPDMIAALRAMGWAEEAGVLESFSAPRTDRINKQELQAEILRHKREALALKRAGRMAEARDELKQAKTLEQMLEASQVPKPEAMTEDDEHVEVSYQDMQDPEMLAALQALGFSEPDMKKEKRALEEEVSAVKWSAAAMQSREQAKHRTDQAALKPMKIPATTSYIIDDVDDTGEALTIQSLKSDPELAAALKGMNLDGEVGELPPSHAEAVETPQRRPKPRAIPSMQELPQRSKREIQKELLGRKRKALALRREGKEDEAEKELKDASVLEAQLKALEDAERPPVHVHENEEVDEDNTEQAEVTDEDMNDPAMLAALSEMGFKEDVSTKANDKKEEATRRESSFEGEYGEIGLLVDIVPPLFSRATHTPPVAPVNQHQDLLTGDIFVPSVPEKKTIEPPAVLAAVQPPVPSTNLNLNVPSSSIEQEILEHKRRALQFKRSGNVAAAKEELRQAKLLENHRQAVAVEEVPVPRPSGAAPPKDSSRISPPATGQAPRSKDRMKIQQESLAHKRRALALRKEGKMDEAEAEFEKAKALEKQLEEMDPPSRVPGLQASAMDGVEDLLDPQLLAALSGLGWQDEEMKLPSSRSPQQQQQQQKQSSSSPSQELQDRVRKLKVRAVELKRAGRQQEALEVLREAKALENINKS